MSVGYIIHKSKKFTSAWPLILLFFKEFKKYPFAFCCRKREEEKNKIYR
jgi:hypothetical protein